MGGARGSALAESEISQHLQHQVVLHPGKSMDTQRHLIINKSMLTHILLMIGSPGLPGNAQLFHRRLSLL